MIFNAVATYNGLITQAQDASHECAETTSGTEATDLMTPALPEAGTLARIWEDERASQKADELAHGILSRSLSVDDIKRDAETDQHMSRAVLLVAVHSLKDDNENGVWRCKLWPESVDDKGWR